MRLSELAGEDEGGEKSAKDHEDNGEMQNFYVFIRPTFSWLDLMYIINHTEESFNYGIQMKKRS